MLPLAFRSKSLLSTARPARFPGLSGQRAYCLPLDRYATLGLQVQEHTVYRYTSTLPWAFWAKSLLSTTKTARSPELSGPRSYFLSLDRHETLGPLVQEPNVYR
ncbi:hypothetical protein ElyMa_002183700 [Elysia marginata]|uniref:Uncharacterized protein n=1 Tax=Elysia marginata TaxID=1093978 RepID=A0AAV4FRH4_9GAST|nr:hypothetical protein ElyMa_002183700 [Elysia marginata]